MIWVLIGLWGSVGGASADQGILPRSFVETEASVGQEQTTGLDQLAADLVKGLFPELAMSALSVQSESPSKFLEASGDRIWSLLNSDSDAPNEVWLDRETLHYFLRALRESPNPKIHHLLDAIAGAWIRRTEDHLAITWYMTEAQTLELIHPSQAARWQLYAVHVPREVTFRARFEDGILTVDGLDEGVDPLWLSMKVPFLPDTVYARGFWLDLVSGDLRVEAGVLGNTVALVARAQLMARRYDGIDFWRTLRRRSRQFFRV